VDGQHSATGTLHYVAQVVDLRSPDIPAANLLKLVARLRGCLGEDFDVVLEVDQIEMESPPTRPYCSRHPVGSLRLL